MTADRPGAVRVDVQGHVAVVTLARPPVNAINSALREELARALASLEADTGIRVAVLTGGERIFSAGVDIHELLAAPPEDAVPRNRRYQEIFLAVEHGRVPVIAAVNGYALGGGCELIMACAVRVAAEDAFLALPEIGLGGVPGAGGPQRLPRLVGPGMAKRLVLTGARITAREAHEIGLVDALAPPGGAIPVARALAERIASKPPLSVQAAKQAIVLGRDLPADRAQAVALTFVGRVAGTADRAERLRAFLEKRPARPARP